LILLSSQTVVVFFLFLSLSQLLLWFSFSIFFSSIFLFLLSFFLSFILEEIRLSARLVADEMLRGHSTGVAEPALTAWRTYARSRLRKDAAHSFKSLSCLACSRLRARRPVEVVLDGGLMRARHDDRWCARGERF